MPDTTSRFVENFTALPSRQTVFFEADSASASTEFDSPDPFPVKKGNEMPDTTSRFVENFTALPSRQTVFFEADSASASFESNQNQK